ncbi:MAG: hypothetical protein H6970_16065 [Gammaproteobacteria bacterium]|nr:hypothetical protein [Gammaproteobacteria bacterium]MCP5458733.1 hypothetical protein [Gammaproteobacteria bacterium]MCP5460080.1 hypothetical protein [Gammaproteobacteria bacterium]
MNNSDRRVENPISLILTGDRDKALQREARLRAEGRSLLERLAEQDGDEAERRKILEEWAAKDWPPA